MELHMSKIQIKPLVISLLISLGAGGLSAFLTRGSMAQYRNIYKPPLSPPGWVFPVVWTILFILMGIAAYLVYISDSPDKSTALRLYGFQLVLNVAWSIIFFNFNAYLLAFAWLLLLWFMVYLTYKEFGEVNKIAAWLLLPYILWLTFAAYLNLAIALHYL